MIITKWFTGSGPRQILCMLLALAVLGTAAAAMPTASMVPIELCNEGSMLSSDDEDMSIPEVWGQGYTDGFRDGAKFWGGYRLKERLAEHHYNKEQRLTYTAGYRLGYKAGRW